MQAKQVKRCAVYTRKSCEDGLELEYNSLDAQYDSALSYIRSQAANGWRAVPKRYDDGGKLVWRCPNCGNLDQSKMNVARRT